MKESDIEKRLVQAVRAAGGIAIKMSAGGGLPDRLLLFPGGGICFVETKAPGQRPRLLQQLRHEELRRLGFEVFVVDSVEGISEIIKKCTKASCDAESKGGDAE